MLITILIIVNNVIFFSLGLLHFYWAAGGEWALRGAIPTAFTDTFFDPKRLIATRLATLVVAIGLFAFGYITLTHLEDIPKMIPQLWLNIATLAIAAIFLLRAIGNFDYCGFFSKDGTDEFSKRDRAIYSPLCLYLSLSTWIIFFQINIIH
ncbi:MAG: DUF3995 domain-containing protein [Saprospiraceae bacterium]